ncbi:MAG: electron transport complex subunit RsxA [Firmicutes bacterium]|nr:electron transport complex subunit RsxA [Bacillota bacterium]
MTELALLFLGCVIVSRLLPKSTSDLEASLIIGVWTTVVMTLTCLVVWLLLVTVDVPYLQSSIFLLVIVFLVELPFSRRLRYGAPLMVTNLVALGSAFLVTSRGYGLIQSLLLGFGLGLAFTLALVVTAGIQDEMRLTDLPESFAGLSVTIIIAGLMALSLAGFTGLIKM